MKISLLNAWNDWHWCHEHRHAPIMFLFANYWRDGKKSMFSLVFLNFELRLNWKTK